jgi:hypothetical protein
MKLDVDINSIDSKFNETQKELLSSRICDLPLKIPGTRIEELIIKLYRELEQAGISFKPRVYLSDEWGCPQNVPVIAIPFYLADAELTRLEGELSGIEAEDEDEVMMYLRHEAGHSFNYAFNLFKQAEWRRLFGKYTLPYREAYKPVPFSTKYVRHIGGWYAQKHPDEDFAETFAVWLTPGSAWRDRYAGTPALEKLNYVDRIAKTLGRQTPANVGETEDKPLRDLKMTLLSWHKMNAHISNSSFNLHPILDEDLKRLFPESEGQAAAEVMQDYSFQLTRDINYWTGIDRHILEALLTELRERVKVLDLKIGPQQINMRLLGTAVFLTTLVMNYQYRGQLVEK